MLMETPDVRKGNPRVALSDLDVETVYEARLHITEVFTTKFAYDNYTNVKTLFKNHPDYVGRTVAFNLLTNEFITMLNNNISPNFWLEHITNPVNKYLDIKFQHQIHIAKRNKRIHKIKLIEWKLI